jgi:phosphoribosylformylglycinamidine synthase subunit PurL
MIDTVEIAAKTPDEEQPWAELGLKSDEYARIRDILGRRPTTAELAMYSVMWSEHCSYRLCWWASARTPAWWTSATATR